MGAALSVIPWRHQRLRKEWAFELDLKNGQDRIFSEPQSVYSKWWSLISLEVTVTFFFFFLVWLKIISHFGILSLFFLLSPLSLALLFFFFPYCTWFFWFMLSNWRQNPVVQKAFNLLKRKDCRLAYESLFWWSKWKVEYPWAWSVSDGPSDVSSL